MKSSSVYVRDCSLVKAYAVLLFGGDICVKHKEQTVFVDDWIDFKVSFTIIYVFLSLV